MSDLPALDLALDLTAGLLLGLAYFHSLRWISNRLASGRGLPVTIAATLGRLLVLGGALALAGLQGALPLLLMALGVFIARAVVLRRSRGALA